MSDPLRNTFVAFSNQGKGSGPKRNTMDNKAWAKCCKDCKVQDNKTVTGADVDIVFSKVKTKGSNAITFEQFQAALAELGKKKFKKKSTEEQQSSMFELVAGREPGLVGVTKTSKSGGVEKMTDASQYTGTHKERFDESGKGKGIEGRKDIVEDTGYVGNYRGQGTYDDKVGK